MFAVDQDVFPISEGSVRIAPLAERTWRNTGDEPMIMITMQSKLNSLIELGVGDVILFSINYI